MGKILRDLWILSSDGITMYSRVYNPKVNEQLFGAIMSAINKFAEKVADGGISSFELSDIKFSIIKKNEILFVANADLEEKDKRINQELSSISDKFFEVYSDELEKWDGDVSIFSEFEEKIKNSLQDTVKKFKKAFW
ncbi:MAG: hypothetical protein EU543_02315 [Promethearchaeota archaeon]|nr:MAG: hypothetical protein EU543_02315 [Candidatus Lokiarchaeota archaeon]